MGLRGQADQRLIHQLYLDHAAVVLLLFNAEKDTVLPGLRDWRHALGRAMGEATKTLLVAGRIDVDSKFDRNEVRRFAEEAGYRFIETSAVSGQGIPDLRKALMDAIPWEEIPSRSTPAQWKRMKDEIVRMRDEGRVLMTLGQLSDALRIRLPDDDWIDEDTLQTVVGHLDGPGLVKRLDFGEYVLLRPEWINIYAQAIIRTLRAEDQMVGSLPLRSIREGKLLFTAVGPDGAEVAESRLTNPDEERVVLQAMEETLTTRRFCMLQDGDLVFPSYCGRERPDTPTTPDCFVSYAVQGFLYEIYATLVVKLAHCGAFRLEQLWKDAADFCTLGTKKALGLRLVRSSDGRGELFVYHDKGVTLDTRVTFANFIHQHLSSTATEIVQRLRFYLCEHCGEPIENRRLARERLETQGEAAEIRCQRCDRFVKLWDEIEREFADEETKRKVAALNATERVELESRRLGQLLVLEVSARLHSANQKCMEIPGSEDEGIDLLMEFTDDDGRGTGQLVFLQLKSGNSHLTKRKKTNDEVFVVKKQAWVQQWIRQSGPVMLVVGTFAEDERRMRGGDRLEFDQIRWMEVGELLRRESEGGTKPVRQFVFEGEPMDQASIRRLRARVLGR